MGAGSFGRVPWRFAGAASVGLRLVTLGTVILLVRRRAPCRSAWSLSRRLSRGPFSPGPAPGPPAPTGRRGTKFSFSSSVSLVRNDGLLGQLAACRFIVGRGRVQQGQFLSWIHDVQIVGAIGQSAAPAVHLDLAVFHCRDAGRLAIRADPALPPPSRTPSLLGSLIVPRAAPDGLVRFLDGRPSDGVVVQQTSQGHAKHQQQQNQPQRAGFLGRTGRCRNLVLRWSEERHSCLHLG